MERNLSPCMTCSRCQKPENCEDKSCRAWRAWFIGRWDALRAGVRQEMEAAKPSPVGVQVGSQVYAAPHQVAAYLACDPCQGCLCPKDLCKVPCPQKRAWTKARKTAGL